MALHRKARAGKVVEIRTLVEHPMESGLRHEAGRLVPRRAAIYGMDGPALQAESTRRQ